MTTISVIDNGDYTYGIAFNSQNHSEFMGLVEDCKNAGLRFSSELKIWNGGLLQVVGFLESQSQHIISPRGILEKLRSVEIPPERRMLKTPFKKALLARPPLPNKDGGLSFQTEDIIAGIAQSSYGLFLEQGMGKSFVSLTIYNHLREFHGVRQLVIVCEATGIYNWRRYLLEECLGRVTRDDILIIDKNNREQIVSDKPVIICAFRTFLLCSDHWKPKKSKNPTKPVIPFRDNESRMVIIDESQNMGNVDARITKAILAHKKCFAFRYLLSGTPAINSPLKYYPQMKFLDASIFPMTFTEYKNQIAVIGTSFSEFAIAYFKKSALPWIHSRIAPVVSRRRSDDFLALPEHSFNRIWCVMTPKQKRIYAGLVNADLTRMREIDGYVDTKKVCNKFPYYHMALDNPCMLRDLKEEGEFFSVLNEDISSFRFDEDHGKVLILKELLEKYIDDEKEKVVVWAGHPMSIDMLAETFKKYHPMKIHGQLEEEKESKLGSAEYRDSVIEGWKNSSTSSLLILSYKTSSTSINLTQACHQIFFERDYNAVYFEQAPKRLHRTGQTRPVQTDILLFEDSLDGRLDLNLRGKRAVDDAILQAGNNLSGEQWQDIFLGGMVQ